MQVEAAYEHLAKDLTLDVGSFFSPGTSLSLGVGKIYSGIRYPLYDLTRNLFKTVSGNVYVLTHECDVDQTNARILNEDVLVCPLIDFRQFVTGYSATLGDEELRSFLSNLAKHKVSRVVYIPPIQPVLPFGSLMYLNQIGHTHISAFSLAGAEPRCAVTANGLSVIDLMLENHLRRPKSERLAFTQIR